MKNTNTNTTTPRTLSTSTLARIRGAGVPDVTLKRGQFDQAPHDQGVKVYIDVVY
jgi:hypothetical protein